jgi:hypothetical protein
VKSNPVLVVSYPVYSSTVKMEAECSFENVNGLLSDYITLKLSQFLDIIHHSVFYVKHIVLETGYFLHIQVESAQLGPIDRTSLCLQLMDNVQSCIMLIYNHQKPVDLM